MRRLFAMTLLAKLWHSIWSRPWLVLGYMALVFGANGVAARLAVGQISPLLLVLLRWFFVATSLAVIFRQRDWQELRGLIRKHWFTLAWMGLLGFSGFNALFYVAAYYTTAVNLTLLQCATPALVLVGAALVFRTKITGLQIAGMLMTLLSVLVVAAKGDLSRLSSFTFKRGDSLILIACVLYAAFTLGLRARPPVSPLVFFAGMAMASFLWSLPIAGFEVVRGHSYWPTGQGWLVALFAAFGPSFTGQLCYLRGVDLIGPARAGLWANLIPIFGALAAVIVLHEAFTSAHAIAVVLGLGGISLAEWRGPKRRRSVDHAVAARHAELP